MLSKRKIVLLHSALRTIFTNVTQELAENEKVVVYNANAEDTGRVIPRPMQRVLSFLTSALHRS